MCGEEAVLIADALRDLLINIYESSSMGSGVGAPVPVPGTLRRLASLQGRCGWRRPL